MLHLKCKLLSMNLFIYWSNFVFLNQHDWFDFKNEAASDLKQQLCSYIYIISRLALLQFFCY